jgi:hypothetical protein
MEYDIEMNSDVGGAIMDALFKVGGEYHREDEVMGVAWPALWRGLWNGPRPDASPED